jgi:uncharacterized protein YbjT (DUF2867 family)
MADKKTILVTGATGAQGGSVARFLLADGSFAVRCMTRNTNSDSARELRQNGAEVVQGDFDDPSSLRAALKGCYGVFGVTNFWEHFDKEFEHGKNLIDAVADSDVEHFIYSSLPHVEKLTNSELVVPHFDIKGRLEEYARERGLPSTFTHVAFYYENFLTFFPPQKQEDGTASFGFPQGDTPLAAASVEDVGGVVLPIFKNPDKFVGRTVGIVGDDLPPAKYAETMTRHLGRPVVYNYIPREIFAKFDFPGADDLANMFEYNRLHIPNRRKDVEESKALHPGMQTFDAWLSKNSHKF